MLDDLVMGFNATFSNFSVISWRSVFLVEETGENHRHAASHGQTLSHDVGSSTPRLRVNLLNLIQWYENIYET